MKEIIKHVTKYLLISFVVPILLLFLILSTDYSSWGILILLYILLSSFLFLPRLYKKIKKQSKKAILILFLSIFIPYILIATFILYIAKDISINLIPLG